MSEISISLEDFKKLKKFYNKAVKNKKEQFIYQDRQVLTGYAKYMIEYLEPKFKEKQ